LIELSRAVVPFFFASTVVACSTSGSSEERTNVGSSGNKDASSDADLGDSGTPDPSGGRDDTTASCFAACQNGLFSCQAKSGTSTTVTTADITPEPAGCGGTLTKGTEVVALKVDCAERKVCVGSAPGEPASSCVPATFSAFAFAYTPTGGAQNLCTRN
jgi:hypothetical protein